MQGAEQVVKISRCMCIVINLIVFHHELMVIITMREERKKDGKMGGEGTREEKREISGRRKG